MIPAEEQNVPMKGGSERGGRTGTASFEGVADLSLQATSRRSALRTASVRRHDVGRGCRRPVWCFAASCVGIVP